MEFLRDLWAFMRERKKWWLVPTIVMLVLLGALVLLSTESAMAPLIYTVF